VRVACIPVPDKETLCGDPVALLVIVRFPSTEPVDVGVNVTFTVQPFPAIRVAGQLFVSEYGAAVDMLEMETDTVPVLCTFTGCDELATPTC
jgi:hypothetical protein